MIGLLKSYSKYVVIHLEGEFSLHGLAIFLFIGIHAISAMLSWLFFLSGIADLSAALIWAFVAPAPLTTIHFIMFVVWLNADTMEGEQ